ncbi:amidohydrolase [Chitinophaga sp. Cy-1792]|uniref:amidohydrolase n=1 Tax=Chitinophaga sp. Cy-1792 TaxID=2608339 RepID=UPI00141FCAC5|nr:amidohydrolase [Chitinophaga sp. Cy-1792]NIG57139.1 amidohydrolase family protein [Chitinophaga sp. Cy-1792]
MKNKLLTVLLSLGVAFHFLSCNQSKGQHILAGTTVILKGKVRTMDDGDSAITKECVVIQGDTIAYVGNFEKAKAQFQGNVIIKDYKDSLIMPGFIDAHAHVGLEAMVAPLANLSGPPYGQCTSVSDIIDIMDHYADKNHLDKTAILVGNNYDDSQLKPNQQQPTREQLDNIYGDHPVYIIHVSAHMGVGNTKFLNMMGINDGTRADTIAGGTVVKDVKNGKPHVTGLLLENANIAAINKAMSQTHTLPKPLEMMRKAEDTCFAYGLTTICEGRADQATYAMVLAACESGKLKGDYIVCPDYDDFHNNLKQLKTQYNHYTKHFKIGAIKLTFDGSPQGKDAYLSKPYYTPMIGEDASYAGRPIYTYDEAYHHVKDVESIGMPVHIHVNGDSAIGMALAIFKNLKDSGISISQPTPNVMIHCQTAREDQLVLMKKLDPDVMPSFFPTHAYIWGDWYKSNVLGSPRADNISPMKHAENYGLRYTIHTDAPITPPDLITAVYAAANRLTQSNQTLGPDQRVAVYHGLRAITSEAAYQWGEDKSKGKLKPGYKADVVVLTADPMTIDPTKIRDAVHVAYTYKDGNLVYSRPK